MKQIFIYLLILFFFNGCSTIKPNETTKIEKGFFLYEVNVPLKYYTFEDAVETPERLLKFPKNKNELLNNYKSGLYFFGKTGEKKDSLIIKFEKKRIYNSKSINIFIENISMRVENYYQKKYNNFYWIDNMAYIKFYAEFYIEDIGEIDEMIPKLENYRCCYSNTIEKVKGKIIVKVRKVKFIDSPDSSDK